MDIDGLQKKILELSKNAAELQVSISTLRETKRQPIVYSGSSEGSFCLCKVDSPGPVFIKELQYNHSLDSATALTKKVAVWRLKSGLIEIIHNFILFSKLNL